MTSGIAALNQLSETLGELATVPSRAARGAATRINSLLGDQFAGAHDPDGDPWDELLESTKRRKGGDSRILIRSGTTKEETYARPTGSAGIEIVSTAAAQFHQTGTKHMVARPILPAGDELPEAWEDVIEDEISQAFRGKK